MDGIARTLRINFDVARALACLCIISTLLVALPVCADEPLRLHVEGVTKPITAVPPVQFPADTIRPTLVRPGARVINADPVYLLRSRPRVIVVDREPRVAKIRPKSLKIQPKAVKSQSQVVTSQPKLARPAPRSIPNVALPQGVRKMSGTTNSSGTDAVEIDSHGQLTPVPSVEPIAQPHVSIEEALNRRGSITFRKTPLSEVVFLLGDLWHINIVAAENVSGEVNGAFHNAPLREVLSAALAATGYSYRQTGNSLIVLPIDQVGTEDPDFRSETIRIPNALRNDESTLQAAELLLGERGQLRKIGDDSILVVDTASRIARIRQLFTDLSPNGQTTVSSTAPGVASPNSAATSIPEVITQSGIAYFSPQFTEAEQMAEPLQTALGDEVIVAVFPEENRIMVKGTSEDLQLASEAIQHLDKPRPQVRITAMIYDVGLSELEKLGINWSRDLRANANVRNEALENVTQSINELFRFNADLATTGATSIGVSTLTDTFAAGAFLELLDSTSEAKLLADPTITVGDRNQASIRIVRKIPIVGANPVQNSNAVFTQTEFEEAGVILNVLPRISRDGTIELKVQPEYSVVAEITSTGPVIDSRTADTTVRVGNGQMFVLGGLRQKSIVESVRGIPGLMNIKHVGKLFRSHDTEVRESELIVFLKPELITPYTPGSLRQHVAGEVSNKELGAIPHATHCPWTPHCKDPHCPNHHPRPRINCGDQSLEMLGGQGVLPYQIYTETEGPTQNVEVVEEYIEQPTEAVPVPMPHNDFTAAPSPSDEADEVYPPVHIDQRVLQLSGVGRK